MAGAFNHPNQRLEMTRSNVTTIIALLWAILASLNHNGFGVFCWVTAAIWMTLSVVHHLKNQ